ncbi:MAG: adenosylcobinamide-GDP ribazoletransferase [Actinomycetota bacterium]
MIRRNPLSRARHHITVTIGFLTRIPVRHAPDVHMGRVASLFPVIGLLIGAITAGVFALAAEILTIGSAAALALVVGVLVTGAFHLDGLADSADALVGGTTPERRLEILKDSRHGTYGVAAIVCQVLVQFSLVSSQTVGTGVVMLLIAHSVGRAVAVSVMKAAPPAHEGLGAIYVRDVSRFDQAIALFVGGAVITALLGPWGLVVLAAGIVIAGIFARRCAARIGGLVGDVLGATEQVAETLLMIGTVIAIERVNMWWM